jgi:gliding motility-associated-like protein
MGFMENYTTSGHTLRLYVSSSYNSKVLIQMPGISYYDTLYVPKDSVRIAYIPVLKGENNLYDSVDNKGIYIKSDYPISISAMNLSAATTDASIVLPLANIPYAATYVVGNPNPSLNQVLLIAAADSTVISISGVNSITKNTLRPQSGTYSIKLNKGQSYMLGSTNNLSGSVIKVLNNKKVVAFSGDRCSNWPCGACDHQYEQVLPNDVLDTAYTIPPHFGHTNGYLLKFVPLDTATTLKINGITYSNVSRKNPLVVNVKGDSAYYASSNKLFHTYQFLKGASCNGYVTNGYGDPAMLEMVSTKHFGQSALFSTVNSTNLRDHFVSIVIPTYAKNNVYQNKTKIDSSEFKPFPFAKSFSYAELKINDGLHLLECNDGLLAYCYGIGQYESYLYLAGFSLPNFDLDFKDSVVTYDCKNKTIKMQFKAVSSKTLKKYTWTFGDGYTGTGTPVSHQYSNTGFYTIKLVGEDFNGKKDSITKNIKVDYPVFDPVRNKIICGIDTVKFEERNPFFANFKWQDSSTLSSYKAWNNKSIWVTATDTSGYCRFIDSGKVSKIDILSNIFIDSLQNCFKYNRFRFKDSTSIFADQIEHKAWVFNWQTIWDQGDITVHFPMPGKYKVYYDVYTKQANCKARYPIDITVYPNAKVYPKAKGEEFCSNKPILLYDSSQVVTGKIAKVKWDFADNTSITSDSLKTFKTFIYDKYSGEVLRFYNHITITDRNCNDTAVYAVKVWPKPSVDFTLSTADTLKCLPSARWTFSSTTNVATDSFDLKWNFGNGSKSTAHTIKNFRYNTIGKYKVKLLAISPYGCNDSITKNLEVIPVPKAGFYTPDSAKCFKGNLFTLIDSSKGQYLSYNWTLDENQTDTGKRIDSLRYQNYGLKTVKLLVKSPIPGCSDSVTHYLNLLRNPVAIISVDKDSQCLNGNLFNFSQNSSYYNGGAKTYTWLDSGKIVGSGSNLNNYSFKDSGRYKIVYTTTDQEACSDTSFIWVWVSPKASVDFNINDSIQCFVPNKFIFKSLSNPDLKSWYLDQNLSQSSSTDSFILRNISKGKHLIKLISKTPDACRDSIVKSVFVLDKPIAKITVNQDSQCYNKQAFSIKNSSNAVGDKIDFTQFTYGSNPYPNVDSLSPYTFNSIGKKTIKLSIHTIESCSDSTSIDVYVLETPDAVIVGDSICLYQTANITAKQTVGSPIKTWAWDLGDGKSSNIQNPSHTYNTVGNFNMKLTVSDQFGCSNTIIANNSVLVYALPNPNFTVSTSNFGINQMNLKFNPLQNPSYKYQWLFPDGSQSSKDTPSINIAEQFKGNVHLIVTDKNGCIDSSNQFLSYYPNNFNVFIPSAITINGDLLNDGFKIEGIGEVLDFKMVIFNRWGQQIYMSNDPKKAWDGSFQGSYVPDGVYTYLIQFKYFDGKSYTFRGTITVLR